jgi:hypothetical protein
LASQRSRSEADTGRRGREEGTAFGTGRPADGRRQFAPRASASRGVYPRGVAFTASCVPHSKRLPQRRLQLIPPR